MDHHRISPYSRRTGLSLLEILTAVSLLILVVGVVGKNLVNSFQGYISLTNLTYSTTRAQTVMDRLVQQLITGSFTSLNPYDPVDSDFIEFQNIIGVSSGEPIFGGTIRIGLTPMESNVTDGLDNNRNGLVDECGIKVWENPPVGAPLGTPVRETLICNHVPNGGLKFTRQGAILLIDLSIQVVDAPGSAPRSFRLVAGVKMRNSSES